MKTVVIPFFFASIGFAIPIRDLFNRGVVWRGLVYTVLMLFGKLLTGVWLLRFSKPAVRAPLVKKVSNLGWQCWPRNQDRPAKATAPSAEICDSSKTGRGLNALELTSSVSIDVTAWYATKFRPVTLSKLHKPLSLTISCNYHRMNDGIPWRERLSDLIYGIKQRHLYIIWR